MKFTNFETFEREALADGYDEALQRDWEPGTVVPEHTHPFDAYAVVVRGEMWLSCQGTTRHLTPGSTFTLSKGTPHAEQYGSHGASYWVARRN